MGLDEDCLEHFKLQAYCQALALRLDLQNDQAVSLQAMRE